MRIKPTCQPRRQLWPIPPFSGLGAEVRLVGRIFEGRVAARLAAAGYVGPDVPARYDRQIERAIEDVRAAGGAVGPSVN